MRCGNPPDNNHLQLYRNLQLDNWKDDDEDDLDLKLGILQIDCLEEYQSNAFVRLKFLDDGERIC